MAEKTGKTERSSDSERPNSALSEKTQLDSLAPANAVPNTQGLLDKEVDINNVQSARNSTDVEVDADPTSTPTDSSTAGEAHDGRRNGQVPEDLAMTAVLSGVTTNNNTGNNTNSDEPTEYYPEGGAEAWLVVLGSWFALFPSLGVLNSAGIFQTYISTHQLVNETQGTIGWIFSINAFMTFFTGIYIGPIFDKYGPRWPVLAGTVLLTASFVALSFSHKYWHFILSLGLLNGLGLALLFTPSIAVVGHYFKRRRGLATGIASTSGGLGGICIPLMMQSLFKHVGWGWSIRVLALISLVMSGMSNFLLRSRLPPDPNASAHPDMRILLQLPFAMTTVGIFLMEMGLFIPLTYISMYALSRGLSESLASQAIMVLNVGSVLGRVLPGYYADKIGIFNTNMVTNISSVIACLGLWLPTSLAGSATSTSAAEGGDHKSSAVAPVIVFALLFGFTSGSNISLAPVSIGSMCRTENYGRYYATCYTVVAVATLIGVPIAGNILTSNGGKFWGLIIFTASLYVGAFVALLAAKVAKVGWKVTALF